MCIGIIWNNSFSRRTHPGWDSNRTSATANVTLYCTWRPSDLTTGLHGQVAPTCTKLCSTSTVADASFVRSSSSYTQFVRYPSFDRQPVPVEAWITYKLCILEYIVFSMIQRRNIWPNSVLTIDCDPSGLRCTTVPSYKRLADSSFSVAGPTAWNSLQVDFRCTLIQLVL